MCAQAALHIEPRRKRRVPTVNEIVFISLKDESGLLDLMVKPEVYARLRDILRSSTLLVMEGVTQRSGRAVSVFVQEATALEALPER